MGRHPRPLRDCGVPPLLLAVGAGAALRGRGLSPRRLMAVSRHPLGLRGAAGPRHGGVRDAVLQVLYCTVLYCTMHCSSGCCTSSPRTGGRSGGCEANSNSTEILQTPSISLLDSRSVSIKEMLKK